MAAYHGEFRRETLIAIDAVSDALRIAARGMGDISIKTGRDIVTTADVAVEDAVREALKAALGQTVVGEERGGEAPADGSPYWLVDPICGTRNFASGTTLYCVNLALVEDGLVTIAVVGDPSTGETVVSECGGGAWALKADGRRRLSTSDESRAVVIEEGKSRGSQREHAARLIAATIRADRWSFRSLGTTLSLPYLAAGRISAYAVLLVTSVHAAPGTLLVTEAGGAISDIDGQPWTLDSDSLIASANDGLQAELIELARSAAP
jgi:myo-inositol-1(or 4)-monophosphatase